MTTEKKPLSPQEFHNLPYAKRLDIVVKLYIERCTPEELIVNKKLNKVYFALRRHFIKEQPMTLQCFYDWLYTLTDKVPIDLTTAYQRVEQHRVTMRMQCNAPEKTVKPYDSLLDCLGRL
jgi:hypothetical protein